MNGQNLEQNSVNVEESGNASGTNSDKKSRDGKKKLIVIIGIALCALAVVSVLIVSLTNNDGEEKERETFAPLELSQLYETKPEDFDIMEYDKYLQKDRMVRLYDIQSGVTVSIDDESYKHQGEGVVLMYEMIQAIIAGDSYAYNSMVSEDVGHYESFTQQQLYAIRITKESQSIKEGKSGSYTEYVFTLEYKIHENNGTFKDNLLSDTARPHTIIINDSTGELLIMDIIDVPKKVK